MADLPLSRTGASLDVRAYLDPAGKPIATDSRIHDGLRITDLVARISEPIEGLVWRCGCGALGDGQGRVRRYVPCERHG